MEQMLFAAEIDVRHVRLELEYRSHLARQRVVDLENGLKLIDHQCDATLSPDGHLRGQAEELLDRGVSVFRTGYCAKLEYRRDRTVGPARESDGRVQRQVAEDVADAADGLIERRDKPLIQRGCEKTREF